MAKADREAMLPPSLRRFSGIGLLAFALLLFWLIKRWRRANTRRVTEEATVEEDVAPQIALKSGFRRIPVRQKVTLVTNDTVFDSNALSSLDSSAASAASQPLSILPNALAPLLEIARVCDLYVITQCASDATEQAVRDALRDAGVVDAGLNDIKVVFCETEAGRGSIARQIEPTMHVDSAAVIVDGLRPFVPSLVGVKTPYNAHSLEAAAAAGRGGGVLAVVDDLSAHFMSKTAEEASA